MLELYVRVYNIASRWAQRIKEEQQGMTMIEYGVMAAFLVIVLIAGINAAGPSLRKWLTEAIKDITTTKIK